MNLDTAETIIKIGKILDEKTGYWNPFLQDVSEHEIDPLWVAAVLFLIQDRYISCIPDDKQIEFFKETKKILRTMEEEGAGYVFKLNPLKDK